MKKWIKDILPYIIIIVIALLIRTFLVTLVRVDGTSMDPTLKNNDIIVLKKYDKKYQYGDIVILNYMDTKLVKRIIGLPGEHIKVANGKLYVNGKKVDDPYSQLTNDFYLENLGYDKIPKGYYFVMGDNRKASSDSRMIGLIKESDILGTVSFRIFPFNHIGTVK